VSKLPSKKANHSSKIAIVGAGFVGSTAAYACMIDGAVSEIALIDVNREKAEGEAMDLQHGIPFKPNVKVTFGNDYSLCKGADIVVICAGAHQKPGETRLDLVNKNATMFKQMIPSITKYNKNCILLVVSNPLDVLTYLALKYSKFSKNRVFGSGTILDTSRFRYLLSRHFGVSPNSVHAYILGEHGDSSFPVWSTANIAGVPLKNFREYNKKKMDNIYLKTKNAAYEVISRKGATYYAIGLGVAKIVRSILSDQNEVFALSSYLNNYQGVSGICLSVPTIVNRNGVKKQIKLPLNSLEKKQLRKSANVINGILRGCMNC
jgi:L-lactate dehydrogenase|tara:strand:+ start:30918 stop:31877 length:960 start_codon:yes stop_codon:yes gene_type:complete